MMNRVRVEVGEVGFSVEGIVFDKDGTLLQFAPYWGRWADELVKGLSLYAPSATLEASIGLRRGAGRRLGYDPEGPFAMASMVELRALLAGNLYRAGISWEDAVSLCSQVMEAAEQVLEDGEGLMLMPGAQQLLEACRAEGLPLAVATSDHTAAAERQLERLGIRHFFATVVGSDRVRNGKPFPDMALLACREAGIQVSDALMVGDTGADRLLAGQAGMAGFVQIREVGMGIGSNGTGFASSTGPGSGSGCGCSSGSSCGSNIANGSSAIKPAWPVIIHYNEVRLRREERN